MHIRRDAYSLGVHPPFSIFQHCCYLLGTRRRTATCSLALLWLDSSLAKIFYFYIENRSEIFLQFEMILLLFYKYTNKAPGISHYIEWMFPSASEIKQRETTWAQELLHQIIIPSKWIDYLATNTDNSWQRNWVPMVHIHCIRYHSLYILPLITNPFQSSFILDQCSLTLIMNTLPYIDKKKWHYYMDFFLRKTLS